MMKHAIGFLALCCLGVGPLAAQIPGYENTDPPVREHSGTVQPHKGTADNVKLHPEYKKLVDELKRLQEQLKSAATSADAAQKQREIAAAHSRLTNYIRSGKPTVLDTPPMQGLPPPPPPPPTAPPSPKMQTPVKATSTGPGPEKRTEAPEFYANFWHFERIRPDPNDGAMVISMFREFQGGSGSRALNWQGNSFSTKEVQVYTPGQRIETTTEISGSLAPDGATLESCEVRVFEDGRKEDGRTWWEKRELVLFNVPLARIERKPEGTYLHYEIAGADALKKNVVSFAHEFDTGQPHALIWEPLAGKHMNRIGEPSLTMRIFRPPQ